MKPERRFLRFFPRLLTCLLLAAYLLSVLVTFVSWAGAWWLDFFGLFFPLLLGILLVAGLLWIRKDRRWSLACLLVLLCGWRSFGVTFGFPTTRPNNSGNGSLRVITYNVRSFRPIGIEWQYSRSAYSDLLDTFGADIVCMQEFETRDPKDSTFYNNILYFRRHLKTPYFYFAIDTTYYSSQAWFYDGIILFSRLPLIDTGRLALGGGRLNLIYADILKGRDTIRILSTHLQSFRLDSRDYEDLQRLAGISDPGPGATGNLLRKLALGFSLREKQARVVRRAVRSSPYPVILCGDFNTVPNSMAYFTVRGPLRDCFLGQQFGLGRTFYRLSPTLRIDYILADPRFRIRSFRVDPVLVSDHYPVMADLSLKP